MKKSNFISEISGLRGVAILLVVLDHYDFPLMSGGFIGVDVFFVISGFLITGLIYDEYYQSQRHNPLKSSISLRNFYYKRAKRILPASIAILLIVSIWYAATANTVRVAQVVSDATSALIFSANIHFSQLSTDYFASDASRSPLLHYWSLSVEEQFYFIWPFFLLAILSLHKVKYRSRYIRWNERILLATLFIVIFSYVISIINFNNNSTSAYFLTQNRVWELAIGGGFSIAARMGILIFPTRYTRLVHNLSLFMILLSISFVTPENFGITIVIPVVSAGVYLFSLHQELAEDRKWKGIGANRFLIYMGTISYSLYLIHWPLLIIIAEESGKSSFGFHASIFPLAIVLSHLCYKFIESPFLKKKKTNNLEPIKQTPRTSAWYISVGSIVLVVFISLTFITNMKPNSISQTQISSIDLNSLFPKDVNNFSTFPSSSNSEIGSSANEATQTKIDALTTKWEKDLDTELRDGTISKENLKLLPSLISARNQYELMCWKVVNLPCELYRAPNFTRKVILLGDSRMLMLLPPIVEYFKGLSGWKVLNWSLQACSVTKYDEEESPNDECKKRQKFIIENLASENPDLVIVSEKYHSNLQYYSKLIDFLNKFSPRKYITVVPYSYLLTPPEQCFSKDGSYKIKCFSTDPSIPQSLYQIKSLFQSRSIPFLDLNKLVCRGAICPPMHNGVLVFRDTSHINVKFAESLTGVIGIQLNDALSGIDFSTSP